ncbi:MAG TPA: hypothetical protein VFI91_01285 [Longimicrobiaceae bacterium]|nr:hypothetical protein [Longimicrobiaceae bacterium]
MHRPLAIVVTAALTACGAPTDSAAPETALLTTDHRAQLDSLGIPIALPTHVPAGFQVARVATHEVGPAPMDMPGYTIRYVHESGECFTIETARGGLGGPVTERQLAIYPDAFPAPADMPYLIYWTGDEAEPGFRPRSLFSDWIGGPPVFYRIASGGAVAGDCARIDPEVASRIAESLRPVS